MPQAMGGSGADGEDELLRIMGRKPEESVLAKEGVRPVPPADTSWSPTVGESCELLYLDGWWPVRPKSLKGEKWTVIYEAANQKHVVSRAQLTLTLTLTPTPTPTPTPTLNPTLTLTLTLTRSAGRSCAR